MGTMILKLRFDSNSKSFCFFVYHALTTMTTLTTLTTLTTFNIPLVATIRLHCWWLLLVGALSLRMEYDANNETLFSYDIKIGFVFEASGTDVSHPHCNFLVAILGPCLYTSVLHSVPIIGVAKRRFFSIHRYITATITDYIDIFFLFSLFFFFHLHLQWLQFVLYRSWTWGRTRNWLYIHII